MRVLRNRHRHHRYLFVFEASFARFSCILTPEPCAFPSIGYPELKLCFQLFILLVSACMHALILLLLSTTHYRHWIQQPARRATSNTNESAGAREWQDPKQNSFSWQGHDGWMRMHLRGIACRLSAFQTRKRRPDKTPQG